ncbi:hypothetical protein Tco_1070416 [Tanacetum coccineum]|uniref:Uncharacterized protein n=1 Tax=Tanacetum coccineum TaxID=301880 RepID=A0ABQ5HMG2_9ASTR
MDELIVHVSEKTYAYGAIRAENQDLLSTISELKTMIGKKTGRILLLTGGRESNCILILQSHLAASSPFCIIPKATSTSHCYGTEDCHIFNFEYTINDHIPDYLLTVLPSFKDGKDHLVLLVNGEKQEKASLHLNCSSISPCHNQSSVTICNRVLKKHGLDECVSMSTPMATERLYADLQGTLTDQTYLRCKDITVEKGNCGKCNLQTEYQLADLFTKALQKNVYENLVHLIIMAQQQHAADVHPDELCPPNKRYDLMDATRSNLEMCNCSDDESHQQESSITIQHCSFFIGSMDLYGTVLAYFEGIRIKVSAQQVLGFTMELKTQSNFKTTGLLQPWQTLCKIFSKCLTTRVTGWDQPPLQIMQMLYCFVNNIHVDYAELLWEGLYYSLHHPTSSIPYPRFTKIIVSHYMTIFPEISRRARDKYHNLQDDDIMKNIFNSGRHKDKVGMQIPAWMITEEMKHTEHYRMYTEVFGIDVPLTQSQPTESTQGTHRTPSAPRSPNPNKEAAESSAPRRSTMIRLRIPERRSARLTPPAPVPNVDKADEMILQDTLQVSLAEHKSREEQEARENVALVDEHLASEEIDKMVEGQENVVDDSSIPRNDESNILGTRIEPRSDKDKSEWKRKARGGLSFMRYKDVMVTCFYIYGQGSGQVKSFDTLADNLHDVMVETLPAMVDKHIKEQVVKQVPEQVRNQVPVYVAEGLILERQKAKEETERLIAKAILQERGNIQAQIKTHIDNAIANVIPSQVDASVRSYMSGHILHVHPAQSQTSSVPEQQYQLYLAMKDDPQLQQQDIAIWLALQMKFERATVPQTACRTPAVRLRDQDEPHDDAHPEGENSAKQQKTSKYEAYVSRESSSGQDLKKELAPSTSDDDDIPSKQVSQDIMEEISLTINEAKLRKMADEMLRQRCTSGDEHQYHIDQMKNFLKSDIVWETPSLSLINQDLLYLKKGNSGPEKIVLSLHKFPAVIFNDDDIEERKQKELESKEEVLFNLKDLDSSCQELLGIGS